MFRYRSPYFVRDRPESVPDEQTIEATETWQQLVERRYPSGETSAAVFWRIMITDLIMQELPLRRANADVGRPAAFQFHGGSPLNKVICDSVRMMIVGQTFFATERGYAGVGLPNVVEGDEV
ncbi:hypothetical protein CcaCcLH18_08007 [Colletotrichum camelliae]|nr:hypothetical protein CcaCcLH18_08007 [Colletotrichum camelliae]